MIMVQIVSKDWNWNSLFKMQICLIHNSFIWRNIKKFEKYHESHRETQDFHKKILLELSFIWLIEIFKPPVQI
jgi:hypothetical protein